MAQPSKRRSVGTKKPGGKSSENRRSPLDHLEVEWQFDAPDLRSVEGWLSQYSSGSGLVVAPDSTETITDTYYDTEDWRFYRAGYALRVRKTGGEVESSERCAREATSLRPIVLGS